MFDSPFDFCTVCRQYVLLDQTYRQCALEHECAGRVRCPLERCFTGIEFGAARVAAKPRVPARRREK